VALSDINEDIQLLYNLFAQNNQYYSDYLTNLPQSNRHQSDEQSDSQNNSSNDNWNLNITYHFSLPDE
jgi:hypothetical protein